MLKNRFLSLFPKVFNSPDDMNGGYDEYPDDVGADDVPDGEEEDTDEEDSEDSDDEEEDGEEPENDEDDEDSDEEEPESDEEDSQEPDSDRKDYVHKDEVSKIIQRRVNRLQKKLESSEESSKIVGTISSITGIPVESLSGQLVEAAARMVAQRDNIPVEQARTKVNDLVNAADQQNAKRQLDLDKEEIKILRDPKKYPGYDDFSEEIRELAMDRGLKLSEAYVLVTADRRRVMENYKKETPAKKKAKSLKKKTGSGAKPAKPSNKSNLTQLERKALGDVSADDLLMYADASSSYDKVIAKKNKRK